MRFIQFIIFVSLLIGLIVARYGFSAGEPSGFTRLVNLVDTRLINIAAYPGLFALLLGILLGMFIFPLIYRLAEFGFADVLLPAAHRQQAECIDPRTNVMYSTVDRKTLDQAPNETPAG